MRHVAANVMEGTQSSDGLGSQRPAVGATADAAAGRVLDMGRDSLHVEHSTGFLLHWEEAAGGGGGC